MGYQLDCTKEELVQIFGQSYQAMVLDARQHMLLTPEQQEEDNEQFLLRQQPRFSILVKITKVLGVELPDDLSSLYKEAEEIMLLARGLDNGERSSTDRETT